MIVQRRKWVSASLGASALAALLSGTAVRAQPAQPLPATQTMQQTLPFVGHGAFFSPETNRSPAIDPQVFVKDVSAAEGTGPQNIAHGAGLRPARIDQSPELVLYKARGDSLGFTLDRWLAASGTL